MSIREMSTAIRAAVDVRINREARALRGKVQQGKLVVGGDQYEIIQAVDADVSDGKKLWALRTKNGKAVVIGA